MSPNEPSGFDSLLALERLRGADMKPVLLRVMIDLFVARPQHSPDEIARFEALAFPLTLSVEADAATLIRKLGAHAESPAAVMIGLAGRNRAAHLAYLSIIRTLDADRAHEIALHGAADERAAIASRGDLAESTLLELANRADPEMAIRLGTRPEGSVPARVAQALTQRCLALALLGDDAPARALLARSDMPFDLRAPLFLSADSATRTALAAESARRAFLDRRRPAFPALSPLDGLIESLLAGGNALSGLAETVSEALQLPVARTRILLEDASGEPTVLILRALHAQPAMIVAALLRSGLAYATSWPAISALQALAYQATPASAGLLIAAATEAKAPVSRGVDAGARGARRITPSDAAKPAAAVPIAGTTVRGRRDAQSAATSRKLRP